MKAIIIFNFLISMVFTLCYAYQFFYVFVGLFKKHKKYRANKNHHYAIVISARNEATVIGNLIQSINEQSYPKELIDIFVIADNCTDDTALVARQEGATVYERFDRTLVGKGYALDWFFKKLEEENKTEFDGYIIFDADNVLDREFITEINKVFDNGYPIVTSYRNSKNYGKNWITAGYSLWFLREAKYLNGPRMMLGTSCAISGTGFLIGAEIIKESGGWIHHLLTEDIEFTTDSIINGKKIGYSANSVLYDEQPTKFSQSYVQRLRWSKGFYQVFTTYGKKLIKGISKKNFACYDMLMTLMPAMLLTLISVAVNIIAIPLGIISQSSELLALMKVLAQTLLSFYTIFFVLGLITTITEWKNIYCGKSHKIFYIFTFPLFMMTYIPISIIALFKKVEWSPIKHSVNVSVSDICSGDATLKK